MNVYEQVSASNRRALLIQHMRRTYRLVSTALNNPDKESGLEDALEIVREATPAFVRYGGLDR